MVCMCLLSALWSQWTLLAGIVIYVAYKWSTSTYDFFSKKNVKFEKPVPLLGNFKGVILQTESMFEIVKRIYLKFKDHKFSGIYENRNPLLMINDPDLIKQVTVKDFDYFLNHRVLFKAADEPLFGNSLFVLENQIWKDMRATLSPAFTGSKMRQMFELIEECGKTVGKHLKSQAGTGELDEVDVKEFFTRFTNDVIATCAFGLKINSLTEKDNQFYKMGSKATNFSGLVSLKFFLWSNFPAVMRLLKIPLFDKSFTSYFSDLVLKTMNYRSEHGIVRPDMINLLMQARKGILEATDLGKGDATDGFATAQESAVGQKGVSRNWSDEHIVAQCFLFFVAGFETTATLMCFCSHELMENPDIQEKLIQEIDDVRAELDGKPLTYEILQKMKYMDMVVSETLRKWPAAIATDRVCAKPYTLKDNATGQKVEIAVGEYIWIPIVGIHYNPEYYPNPNKFDPERFSDENKGNIKPFTYLPFGAGPRNCIGSRFALMETKAILFYLLSEFTFEASAKTTIPIKLSAAGFQLKPKKGFWLKFKPRN